MTGFLSGAFRKGATVDEIFEITKIKTYFIEQMKELVEEEEAIIKYKGGLPTDEMLITAKKDVGQGIKIINMS